LLEVGRVCRITAGRDVGELCVIVDGKKDGKFEVEGPNVKKTFRGVSHLEPTPTVLDIKKGAYIDDVLKAFEKAGVKTSI